MRQGADDWPLLADFGSISKRGADCAVSGEGLLSIYCRLNQRGEPLGPVVDCIVCSGLTSRGVPLEFVWYMGRDPLWVGTSRRWEAWAAIGATDYEVRAVRYGIVDMPTLPFECGTVLPAVPQSVEDLALGCAELEEGCKPENGFYEEVAEEEVGDLVAEGKMVSSAFWVWQGEGVDRKGRFVVNLARQSKHWEKGSVRMETLPGFALDLKEGDHLMSWDIKSGYRHFALHPCMQNYFLFHYAGRYYRCRALPFGWGRSVLWFSKLMRPVVKYIRTMWRYRLLPWVDDFLCAPSDGRRAAGPKDCQRARGRLGRLFGSLGIVRHPEKGCWEGATQLEHLGFLIDTKELKVYVPDRKILRVQRLARRLLGLAARNRRLVPADKLRTFCGVCVSLTLALPLARFFTRSLYWDQARAEQAAREGVGSGGETIERRPRGRKGKGEVTIDRVRLSRQSLRDLRHWRNLVRGDGRDLVRVEADVGMHADAADVGYGGTLGWELEQGRPGMWAGRGFWTAADRVQSITLRELRAVRLLLQQHFAEYVKDDRVKRVLLHEDNRAVVYVLNAMVSASRPLMSELRKLRQLLEVLGVRIEAQWIPSAVNRFADALSRQWDPGDVQATGALVEEFATAYAMAPVFPYPPVGDHPIARAKQLGIQLEEYWGDGRARLFNPPFDLLPLVVRKLETERGAGVVVAPRWTAQPWYHRLMRLADRVHVLEAGVEPEGLFQSEKRVNPRWGMVVAEVNVQGGTISGGSEVPGA